MVLLRLETIFYPLDWTQIPTKDHVTEKILNPKGLLPPERVS